MTALLTATPLTAEEPASPVLELRDWLRLAYANSPDLRIARSQLERVRAEHQGVLAFFEPVLSSAAGQNDWMSEVPEATRGNHLTQNAIMGRLGIEAPVQPGAYLSLGVAERYLLEPDDDYEQLYRSTAAARVEIPLWRDRFLSEWRFQDGEAAALVAASLHQWLAVMQTVRHDVELAFIAVLSAAAERAEAHSAADRVDALLNEAKALVELSVVPEYQLHVTHTEALLRREEAEAADHLCHRRGIRLAQLAGLARAVPVVTERGALLAWAQALPALNDVNLEQAVARRGSLLEISARTQAARAQLGLATEQLKPSVDLSLSASFQGEDPDTPWGQDELLTEQNTGNEIALVWTQPLGSRREKAAVRAAEAQVRKLAAEHDRERLAIGAELEAALDAVGSARRRLALSQDAVAAAARALKAEQERFQLGEGRSRNVLDAQKDISTAIRRRDAGAAALLSAHADWSYATGYVNDEMPQPIPVEGLDGEN